MDVSSASARRPLSIVDQAAWLGLEPRTPKIRRVTQVRFVRANWSETRDFAVRYFAREANAAAFARRIEADGGVVEVHVADVVEWRRVSL